MSDPNAATYGFDVVRRGYATDQVDRALAALAADRDSAWEQLGVLGGGLREMEKRLADLHEQAVDTPLPDYAVLSEQAAGLMRIAENEVVAIRTAADHAAEDYRDAAHEAGEKATSEARTYALAVRAEAEQAVRRIEERTRGEAERIRAEADHEAREVSDNATAEAAKVRVSAAAAGEAAEAKLAELRRQADEEFAAINARANAKETETSAAAEARLKEAEQFREEMLALIRTIDSAAQADAESVIDRARDEADRIHGQTDEWLEEFGDRYETVNQHLEHIKAHMRELTGAKVGAPEPEEEPPAPEEPETQQPETDQAETTVLPPVPPRPPFAPPTQAQPEAETKIAPKIVIVDDGTAYDAPAPRVIRRG